MIGVYFIILLVLCFATCIAEIITLLFFKNKTKLFTPVLVSNVITNPILNLIYPSVYYLMYCITPNIGVCYYLGFIILTILEIGVVFLEAWIYGFFTDLSFRNRIIPSIVLNTVSYSIGIFFHIFFDVILFFS